MASLDNQLARFLNYEFGTRGNKRLTNKEIINLIEKIPQEFEEHCEEIRLGALNGKNIYHAPRSKVLEAYLLHSEKLSFWKNKVDEFSGSMKTKKILKLALKKSKEKIKKTYKKYCPPYSEKQGHFAVKFVPPPIPTNKTEYDGPGHPKVETPLDFELAPFADKDFVEQNRRKDPCNCTIL